ncbi:Peptidylprolyl isomerase [Aphelenchoides fujianensis]|nr:Peptidylprolyl isomerase [Aphelenchoides fujianensis]
MASKDEQFEQQDLSKDGGVLKTIKRAGSSDKSPAQGDTVYVLFTCTLPNGEVFASSCDRNAPASFALGKGQVIKAWDLGVSTMKQGERCELICRADYAYGPSGSPPKIPADATLKLDIELLRFEGEDTSPDRDGTITKSIIEEGEKYNCPSENATKEKKKQAPLLKCQYCPSTFRAPGGLKDHEGSDECKLRAAKWQAEKEEKQRKKEAKKTEKQGKEAGGSGFF